MYCKDCGKKMTKIPTESGWSTKYICENCGLKLEKIAHDNNGGWNYDTYNYSK